MKTTTKKYRTNSSHVRALVRAHIMDCVTDEAGDTLPTLEAARSILQSEFDRVANYPANLKRIPNNQERFHDYLMGIPFGFEFANHKIAEFLNSLGINPENAEYASDKSARLYTYLIYREMLGS